jgi:DNA-binding NtrC family response regulator
MALLKRTPHVDVLFTDIDLKDKIASGIELAQDAAGHWPNLKVLYTTGRDLTDGMKARFVENSAFLPKPYTVEELLRTLSEHFKIKPAAAP